MSIQEENGMVGNNPAGDAVANAPADSAPTAPAAGASANDVETLRRAIIDIKGHIEQIEAILADLGDLAEPSEKDDVSEAATDDEIKDLLKKYSRL